MEEKGKKKVPSSGVIFNSKDSLSIINKGIQKMALIELIALFVHCEVEV